MPTPRNHPQDQGENLKTKLKKKISLRVSALCYAETCQD